MERITKEFKLSEIGLIETECLVSKGNEQKKVLGDPIKLKTLWDNGANFCFISPEKAKELLLLSLGKQSFINVRGEFDSPVYVVNVHFSRTWIETVIAFEKKALDYDFVVGMDLILRNNFNIKQFRDGSLFSYEKI